MMHEEYTEVYHGILLNHIFLLFQSIIIIIIRMEKEFTGYVVERVITCDISGPIFSNGDRVTVVVDKSNGRILRIVSGVPDDITIEIIRFPPDSTLLPGFIDCHVHLTIGTDDYQLDHMRLSSADKSLRALKAAQGLLQAGFTTIRSAGDADKYYPSFAVANSINKGDFEGPRIVGAGHYISVTVSSLSHIFLVILSQPPGGRWRYQFFGPRDVSLLLRGWNHCRWNP